MIGKSSLTVGGQGCTLTCLNMAAEAFGITGYTPDKMCKQDIFNDDGLVLWSKLPNIGMTGLRVRGYDKAAVVKATEDQDNQVILEVRTKYGPHWVLIVGNAQDGGFLINDPLDGKQKTTAAYPTITGYAVLRKYEKKNSSVAPNMDQVPSPQYRESIENAKRGGRTSGIDPHRVATPNEMVKFFFRYGLFESEDGALTRERVIDALEKVWKLKNQGGQLVSANRIPG